MDGPYVYFWPKILPLRTHHHLKFHNPNDIIEGIEENSIQVNSEENNGIANHTSTVQPSTTVVPDNSVPSAAAKCECLATEENTSNVEPNPSTENTSNQQPDPSDICLTEECVLAASTVLSSLNRNADPCEG